MNLVTLHNIDRKEIHDENLFITGTLYKMRPDECMETPEEVVRIMFNKFTEIRGATWLEPCAGKMGILKRLHHQSLDYDGEVWYNEINWELKHAIKKQYPSFHTIEEADSLKTDCGRTLSVFRKPFDRVVMNPPFNLAHRFLRMAIDHWCKKGGEIVTLFPTLSLSKLHSEPKTFLHMFFSQKVSIEKIPFSCDYGAPVSLIHIIK